MTASKTFVEATICSGEEKLSQRETTHSCLRSFLLRNRSDKAPLILTQPAMPGYSYLKTTRNFSGQSKLWSDLPEAWFADIDQGQIYVFEVGTMKHFSFIAVMQIGLQSRRLHGTKPWAKGFLSKYSTYISEHQQFIWAQILSVTSVSKQAKSDETVVEYKTVRGLGDYSPFTFWLFLINLQDWYLK